MAHTNIQFSNCTPLLDFINPQNEYYHKMHLEWTVDSESPDIFKMEIYRFIGNLSTCVNPESVSENYPSKLIFSARQDNTNVIVEQYFPYTSSSIISNKTIKTMNPSFTDDFTAVKLNDYDLDLFHSFQGIITNQTIIDDIGHTRRVVYYVLKTYSKGTTSEAISYLVTPNFADKSLTCHSTKTQVRHNYLAYEGDEIWRTNVPEALNYSYGGLSRTAVDINRIYKDPTHSGIYGKGGNVWVSDRSSGNIYRYSLRNGELQQIYRTNVKARGHGIGVHPETGSCLAGPGHSSPKLFFCDIDKTSPEFIMNCPGKRWNYGIIPLYNYPDRMYVTDWSDNVGAMFIFGSTLATSTLKPASQTCNGYAAAACPNSHAVQAGLNWNGCAFIHPETVNVIKKDFYNATGIPAPGTRVGVDNYNNYPNTIINTTPSRDTFCLRKGSEFNISMPLSATTASNIVMNWGLPIQADNSSGDDTPGYDGENNMWKVASDNKKTKVYRTAGDWFENDGVDETYIYPYGGYSRYPNIGLNDWASSVLNTKEIEWFLTRNHGVSTCKDISTPSLVQIDPPTLDKTTKVYWDPARPSVYESAYEAWWNMVESKMIRVYVANNSSASWKNGPYFRIYKENKLLDVNGRKWGIRMNVTDIWASAGVGENLDDFYENYYSVWGDIIINRIKSWYNAFANDNSSYIGVIDRINKINGNKQGVQVHPFYKYAISYPVTPLYLNNNLSSETKDKIKYYINHLKYHKFKSMLMSDLYMYSDFTGNLLAATIDSTPDGETDRIHPEPFNPVLSLHLSGYQSNPGYQDTPPYCYPWKNTVPISMSSTVTDISGYDDFTVTFIVSADAGTYTLTSVSVSTDDYPSFLSDTGNSKIITENNIQNNIAFLNYTYHTPSQAGITYLPSGSNNSQPIYVNPKGKFTPTAFIQTSNLYNCSLFNIEVSASVTVFERWPEPKFFINSLDDNNIREDFFCNNRWGVCNPYIAPTTTPEPTTTTTPAPVTTTTTTLPPLPLETCYTISESNVLYDLNGGSGSYTDGDRILYWDIYSPSRWKFQDFTLGGTWLGPLTRNDPVGLYTDGLTNIAVLCPCWATPTTTTLGP